MASRSTVLSKLAERKSRMVKQFRKWRKTHKLGHLKAFRVQKRAVKKLKKILGRLPKEIDWNGCAPVGGPNLQKALLWALANYDVYVTSTNGGTHTPTSYHYRNQAVDIGADSTQAKIRCQHGLYIHFGASFFAELFGPDNYPWVKNGVTYAEPEGTALENLHDTHVHMAVTS